ncbi:acyl-CoA thioesterase [Jatrophihabitans sp. DSM 45814]
MQDHRVARSPRCKVTDTSSRAKQVAKIFKELLDLEALSADHFRARLPEPLSGNPRFFGGALLALTTRAAMLTVDSDRVPHAMQNIFIKAGDSTRPAELIVQRTADGGSFSSRTVTVVQDGKLRCSANFSFHRPEAGQDVNMPIRSDAPSPESDFKRNPVLEGAVITAPFEVREVDVAAFKTGSPHDTSRMLWVRLTEPIADEQLLPCIVAYMSDFGATIGARVIVGASFTTPGLFFSLNHSLWWHRPMPAGEWILIDMRPLTAAGSRGLVSITIHSEGGLHLATVVQEALMRVD